VRERVSERERKGVGEGEGEREEGEGEGERGRRATRLQRRHWAVDGAGNWIYSFLTIADERCQF
jgi:hypothetical protein